MENYLTPLLAVFHQCQRAFTFQHLFSLSLQSGESHRSWVIFPDCQISNFHFPSFFSGLGIVHDTTHFPKQYFFFLPLFATSPATNLVTPHYLSTSFHFLFWLLSKILFQNFQFFFQDISVLHFLAIIFGYSTFWLTLHVPPSINIVIHIFNSKMVIHLILVSYTEFTLLIISLILRWSFI